LLWLALEEQGRRQLLQEESGTALKRIAYEIAAQRGMRLLIPLMDLEDLHRLKPADLWQGDQDRLREASRRYPAELVLAGRMDLAEGAARADWRLLHPQHSEAWQSRGKSAAEALGAGLEEAIDRIAAAYAPVGGDALRTVLVQVLGVRDLNSYLRVDRFLCSLDGVEQVLPLQVRPEQVLWRVQVWGGAAVLNRSAALGHLLRTEPPHPTKAPSRAAAARPAPTPAGPPMAPDLTFRLNP
jgi:hypothetical protein